MLHLYQLNRSDMLNARKIQEFVMFVSRLFLRYPREAFYPLIYEYNISMVLMLSSILVAEKAGPFMYPQGELESLVLAHMKDGLSKILISLGNPNASSMSS